MSRMYWGGDVGEIRIQIYPLVIGYKMRSSIYIKDDVKAYFLPFLLFCF